MESSHGFRILTNADTANDVARIQVECNTLLHLPGPLEPHKGCRRCRPAVWPNNVEPGKNVALKYVASLDSATLNYVLLHYTKLDQRDNKQGENVYQHLKKRERGCEECYVLMQNLACFFFPYASHSAGCYPKAEDIFSECLEWYFSSQVS